MSQKRKRALGSRMKPRGVANLAEQPMEEGQPKSILEPVLSRNPVTQRGGDQAPENEQKMKPKEALTVASSEEYPSLDEVQADLERVLEEASRDVGIEADEAMLPSAEDLDAAAEQGGYPFVPVPSTTEEKGLGEQPDGSYKAIVTIKEGYWSAVTEWADADGITPEEWLSNIITSNIETYAMPVKGR